MSSIPHQEFKNSPTSPIPRSRSDFNYVGLSPREKRWSTDFSNLIPNFSRESSGYLRLLEAETPVTHQPKPQNQTVAKIANDGQEPRPLNNEQESRVTRQCPPLNSSVLIRNPTGEGRRMGRSPTFEPKILNRPSAETCRAIGRSQTFDPNLLCKVKARPSGRTPMVDLSVPHRYPKTNVNAVRRSPTADPKLLSRSPTLDPAVLSRSPRHVKTNPCVVGRSGCRGIPLPPADVVRSQSLRSFRKPESSPTKIRMSESAHGDVAAYGMRPSTVIEANEEEEDFHRLRNFSITPKGLINWGDSFRSHSLTSVPGHMDSGSYNGSQWDVTSSNSYTMTSSGQWEVKAQRFKVVIMGAEEVGKTSLIRQFQTSEYICAFDTSSDVSSSNCVITVILNEEESELEFIDLHSADDDNAEQNKGPKSPDLCHSSSIPMADAYVIVYSVTNRRSFLKALELVSIVQIIFRKSVVLLVGNKSDLVRVRAVTTDEGQTAAKEKSCSFTETSVAINHQVDELLVTILTQIRDKKKQECEGAAASKWSYSQYSFTKAKGLIKKFLKKACFQSKSCDNLQRL